MPLRCAALLTLLLCLDASFLALPAVCAAAEPAPATPAFAGPLTVQPASIQFDDLYARRQLLVSAAVDQAPLDLTSFAEYRSADPQVARVDDRGTVAPVGVGQTTITVTCEGHTATVAVEVQTLDRDRPVHFGREIVPLLSRYGCNSGGCHGKASGQNNFRLSLFGFDQEFDYQALTLEARGRRVFAAHPDRSLILGKAIGLMPHGGGRRFEPGSESYHIVRRWIEQGAPREAADAPHVVRLKIEPTDRILRPGARQQLVVFVEYSDGSQRDVTRSAEFSSNQDVVAAVSEDGLVRINEATGEAALMARYMGQVAVFRALVPHGATLAEIPDFPIENEIDRLVAAKWKKLGLLPSPPASDAAFLRRVTLDLCGRLPTSEEVREYLADTSAGKKAALVDRLLASPDYPAHFAMRWGSILRNSHLAGSTQAAYAFHNWIKEMIASNRPYDEFVRGVVAAAGEWQDAPAVNWYWQMRDDQLHQVTADTAQVFLGIRLQCARCHHHPYERWGQDDYFGLAGFFTRIGRKSFGEPPPYFSAGRVTTGERHPLTGNTPEPKYLDGDIARFSPEQDPRHGLVDWMARPDNPFFARVLVNRLWGHFLGRGLVDQVDDMRETNPPSNPELLDWLARDFIDHKFDMRHTIRQIVLSRTYALDSEPTDANRHDLQNYARFYGRRLIAEVFHDAVEQATGTRTQFSGMAADARAIDLPHEGFGSYFLDTFDRPRRVTGCECERSASATLGQVLLLANSDEIENKIASGTGRVATLLKQQKSDREIIEDLYLSTLNRFPLPEELERTTAYIASLPADSSAQACEDILWSLLNSKEFMFNH